MLASLCVVAKVLTHLQVDALHKAILSCVDAVDEVILLLDAQSVYPNVDGTYWAAPSSDTRRPMLVARREWTNSFSEARNFAAGLAQGRWVVVVDADDFYRTVGNLRRVLEVADEMRGEHAPDVVYGTCINVNERGEELEREHKSIVAYKKDTCHWEGARHNKLVTPLNGELETTFVRCTAVLESLYPEAAQKEKAEATIRDLQEEPKSSRRDLLLARSWWVLDDMTEVVIYAGCAMQSAAPEETAIKRQAYYLLAWAQWSVGGLEAMERVVQAAVAEFPTDVDILHAQAHLAHIWWKLAAERAHTREGGTVISTKFLDKADRGARLLGYGVIETKEKVS